MFLRGNLQVLTAACFVVLACILEHLLDLSAILDLSSLDGAPLLVCLFPLLGFKSPFISGSLFLCHSFGTFLFGNHRILAAQSLLLFLLCKESFSTQGRGNFPLSNDIRSSFGSGSLAKK